jgi:hypothetical protein
MMTRLVRVDIESETATSIRPAKVRVFVNEKLFAEVVVKVELEKGADGGILSVCKTHARALSLPYAQPTRWATFLPRVGETKTPQRLLRCFSVDPTRLALVSPRVDGGILLHKLRARIHAGGTVSKNKKARKRALLFDT